MFQICQIDLAYIMEILQTQFFKQNTLPPRQLDCMLKKVHVLFLYTLYVIHIIYRIHGPTT